MSCGSAICSQSQIQALAVPAFTFARPSLLDIPRRDHLRALWAALSRLEERHRQRLALAELDDRLLADIGVSRTHARHEASKPFWQ